MGDLEQRMCDQFQAQLDVMQQFSSLKWGTLSRLESDKSKNSLDSPSSNVKEGEAKNEEENNEKKGSEKSNVKRLEVLI